MDEPSAEIDAMGSGYPAPVTTPPSTAPYQARHLYHNHGKPINLGRRQFKNQRKDAKARGKKFLRQCREAGFPRQGGGHPEAG